MLAAVTGSFGPPKASLLNYIIINNYYYYSKALAYLFIQFFLILNYTLLFISHFGLLYFFSPIESIPYYLLAFCLN